MLDVRFDPWDLEFQADPYTYYAELRRDSPCLELSGTGRWVVSRYDDVRAIDHDYRRFTSTEGMGARREKINILVGTDPPQHTQTRRTLQPMFRRDALEHWRVRSVEIVDELLDEALEAGTVEWRSQVAARLPVRVTGELLGIPTDGEMMDTYVRWSRAAFESVDARDGDPKLAEIEAAMTEAMGWFTDLVISRQAEHRSEPVDLMDRMLAAGDGDAFSVSDVATLVLSMLAAGTQTTADLLCHLLVVMDANPAQWELLRREPERCTNAIDELLRYEPPQQGLWRTTLEDIEIAGTTVPQNDRVLILFGSANRDEAKWPDPDVFDITRNASDHLGFGIGVHRCIGEPLAKMESTAALERIAHRVKAFELVEPIERHNTSIARGFDRMEVVLTAR